MASLAVGGPPSDLSWSLNEPRPGQKCSGCGSDALPSCLSLRSRRIRRRPWGRSSAWQVGNPSLAAPPDASALHRSGLVGGAGVIGDARPTRVNWPCIFMNLNRCSSSNQQVRQITSSCNRKDSNDGNERSDDDATYAGFHPNEEESASRLQDPSMVNWTK